MIGAFIALIGLVTMICGGALWMSGSAAVPLESGGGVITMEQAKDWRRLSHRLSTVCLIIGLLVAATGLILIG